VDTAGSDSGEAVVGTSAAGSWCFPKEALAEVLPARTHCRLELPDSIWSVWHNNSGMLSNKVNFQHIRQLFTWLF